MLRPWLCFPPVYGGEYGPESAEGSAYTIQCVQDAVCYDLQQRMVHRLRNGNLDWETTFHDLEPPFLHLLSYIPTVFCPTIDETRTKLAYGDWVLPVLKRRLHNPESLNLMQVLNSIEDQVHDPEKGATTVQIGLAESLIPLMVHKKHFIREKVCRIFYFLAFQGPGKKYIMRRYQFLANLARCVEDEDNDVRHQAQETAEMISRHFLGADKLNDADFVVLLIRLLHGNPYTADDSNILMHLMVLKFLLDRDVKALAIKYRAMDALLDKMKHRDENICAAALHCFAVLCMEREGQLLADKKKVLPILSKFLTHKNKIIQAKASLAITFATMTNTSKKLGMTSDIIDTLLDLSEDSSNREKQVMSMKALANLSEHPNGRKYLRKKKTLKRIEGFDVADELADKHRKILLEVIRWKP